MSKHFIYHIFGKKIGCTNNVAIRMKQQNVKEGEYEILEEHTNVKTASDRERELQIEKGYKVDNIPYYKTLKNQKKATTPEVRKKAVINTDYKVISAKRTANTDYSKIDYKASRAKIDWKVKAEKQKKSINQYDLNNNFIKTWPSATEAAKKLNFDNADIGKCCRGKYKSAGGYVWKYAN